MSMELTAMQILRARMDSEYRKHLNELGVSDEVIFGKRLLGKE